MLVFVMQPDGTLTDTMCAHHPASLGRRGQGSQLYALSPWQSLSDTVSVVKAKRTDSFAQGLCVLMFETGTERPALDRGSVQLSRSIVSDFLQPFDRGYTLTNIKQRRQQINTHPA